MGAVSISSARADVAMNAYLRELYPMILRIAQRIQDGLPHGNHYDDMVQAGAQVAWEHHDHYLRGTAPDDFRRWLAVRMKGAMLDLLRDEDWMPRRLRQKNKKIEQAAAVCRSRLLRHPTDTEIAAEAGISLEELHQHFLDANRAAPACLDDYMETHEVRDDGAQLVEELAGKAELKAVLVEAIEDLPEREKIALSLYILEDLTLEEVCAVMGFKSKNTATRLINSATFRCRVFLAARGLESAADF